MATFALIGPNGPSLRTGEFIMPYTYMMPGTYNLELSGRPAGGLLRFDAQTVHAGGDMTLDCGPGMSREFYEWVATAFSRTIYRKDGAVYGSGSATGGLGYPAGAGARRLAYTSPSAAGARRLEFARALVAEVVLPGLDKSAKERASMTVKLSPEDTVLTQSAASGAVRASSKPWFGSDFKLQIDGLEAECKQVVSVATVSATTKISKDYIGAWRVPHKEPAGMGFSNLVIALPGEGTPGFEKVILGFEKWFQDSIKGNSTNRKAGSLEYLSPGGVRAYFQLDFRGLGIVKLSVAPKARTHVELYCESMTFSAQAMACVG